jgi:hypothetical protein
VRLLSEILEEHLKDASWLLTSILIGIAIFNTVHSLKMNFLNNVFESIILVIKQYAVLSAEHGCAFTILMPSPPLIDYSIELDGNRYCIIIYGIRVFEGEEEYYYFNKVVLEPGCRYFVKASGMEVVFTRYE